MLFRSVLLDVARLAALVARPLFTATSALRRLSAVTALRTPCWPFVLEPALVAVPALAILAEEPANLPLSAARSDINLIPAFSTTVFASPARVERLSGVAWHPRPRRDPGLDVFFKILPPCT